VIALVLAGGLSAGAQDPPLLCFGNEPSWCLSLEKPGVARLTIPDEPVAEFQGTGTRLEHLRERVWRGRPTGGTGADLVAFLRESDCSDGMSDVKHPVVARVSLPDGRFLAGCCRITAPAGVAPNAAAATVEGTAWRLTQLQGQDAKALAGQPGGVVVRFEAGRLQGFGGCNQFAGSYTVSRDHMTLGPLAGTMMACAPPVMAVETAFKEAFSGTLYFRVAEGRLALASTSDGTPKLVFDAAPQPRLEGVTWEVTGFNNGRQAVVSPLVGTTLTVSFQDGAIVGNAGCNRFRATYTRDGNRLSVGSPAATRTMCDGKGVMEQEREFLAAIQSATLCAIERDMLDLHRADGERVLTANPVGT
jgi:heat shock protein HslJ